MATNGTRKTMERYGGTPRKRKIIKRAAADLAQGKEDTDCRGKQPASSRCLAPRSSK
jgi:hypothetical protein